MSERLINFTERAKQLMLFDGLVRHRGISPTDIDGLIDYNGNAFILLEGKLAGTPLLYGQKMAIENLSKAIIDGGKECVALVFEHQTKASEDIIIKNCLVREVYSLGYWRNPKSNISVIQAVELLEEYFKGKKIDI